MTSMMRFGSTNPGGKLLMRAGGKGVLVIERLTSGTGSDGRAAGGNDVVTEMGSGVSKRWAALRSGSVPSAGAAAAAAAAKRGRWLGGGGRSEGREGANSDVGTGRGTTSAGTKAGAGRVTADAIRAA
jgi:hypothetical protein